MLKERTRGQTTVEYVVIIAMIVISIVALFIPALISLGVAAISHNLDAGIVVFVLLYAIVAFLFFARRRQQKKAAQTMAGKPTADSSPSDSAKA